MGEIRSSGGRDTLLPRPRMTPGSTPVPTESMLYPEEEVGIVPRTLPWACCVTSGPDLHLSGPQVLRGQTGTMTLSLMLVKPAWDGQVPTSLHIVLDSGF